MELFEKYKENLVLFALTLLIGLNIIYLNAHFSKFTGMVSEFIYFISPSMEVVGTYGMYL